MTSSGLICISKMLRVCNYVKTVEHALTETQSMSTGWPRHWSLCEIASILASDESGDDASLGPGFSGICRESHEVRL